MARPTSLAQDVIICDLCDKAALRFCNGCQTNLCLDCVLKHLHEFESVTHDIVSFKNRKINLVFPECELHPGQRCEAHCQQCQTPVCVMCCIGQHRGHYAVEMTKVVESKKEEIKKEAEEIEGKLIPKYHTEDENTTVKITKMTEEFVQRKSEVKELRKIWHQEVDNIFDKADKLIISIQDTSMASLTRQQNQIKGKIKEMEQTIKEQQQVIKSNLASKISGYVSKLRDYREIPLATDVKVPSLITSTVQGEELRMEIATFIGRLSQSSVSSLSQIVPSIPKGTLLITANAMATIPTEFNDLYRVACVGPDEAWISGGNKTITRVDIHGSVQDTVTITDDYQPNDMAVSRQGELIYSGGFSETVKIVTHGKIQTLITPPQGWFPHGLCCSRSGQGILVSLNKGKRNKIIRYQERTVTQEIDKDERGEPIFKVGEYSVAITENNNGDICVSDLNADEVVVVDRSGRVRFRYDGTPARKEKTFGPRGIVTDSLSQIIVADCNNDCLHILDQNGNFLGCVDNCGLDKPCGLSVDSKGRLWVALLQTGEIKVLQYLKYL